MNDSIFCPYCDHEQPTEDITAEYGGNFEYRDGGCLSVSCTSCDQDFNVNVSIHATFEVDA